MDDTPDRAPDVAPGEAKAVTYASYLKVEELLALQELQSDPPEHDEMLFIVIHQVHEPWFKVMLHGLDRVRGTLSACDLHGSLSGSGEPTRFSRPSSLRSTTLRP